MKNRNSSATDPNMLRSLYCSFHHTCNPSAPLREIKVFLANNRETPINILGALAIDRNPDVRYRVAANPSTPVNILRVLATDTHFDVRSSVAENPRTSIEVLRALATDPSHLIRMVVAHNPRTPVDILRKLATDSHWLVRKGVSRNPSTLVNTLRALSTSETDSDRSGVATNPSTPRDILRALVNNDHDYIRRTAKEALSDINRLFNVIYRKTGSYLNPSIRLTKPIIAKVPENKSNKKKPKKKKPASTVGTRSKRRVNETDNARQLELVRRERQAAQRALRLSKQAQNASKALMLKNANANHNFYFGASSSHPIKNTKHGQSVKKAMKKARSNEY